jgi:hypothetical protein
VGQGCQTGRRKFKKWQGDLGVCVLIKIIIPPNDTFVIVISTALMTVKLFSVKRQPEVLK